VDPNNLILPQMFKYLLCWFPMLFLAVLNGTARDLWYKKYVSELAAHQMSTFSLIILIGLYCYLVVKWFPPNSKKQALTIGIVWTLLTLTFEFGFGLLRGNSWKQLLHAYDFTEGQIWILIPIWLAITPSIVYRFMSK
jgi:hypothetical protein